jgi:hypothetical protein
MKAPEDQGGVKVKCLQCNVNLEIPYLRGILVNVPPEQAAPVVFGGSVTRPGSSHGSAHPVSHGAPPKQTRADEWLKEAAALKDADDVDGAIKLLKRAFEEIRRENVLYSVETFLRLPVYLQRAGKMKDAWQEFNHLLFKGYPNQPKDEAILAIDRAKIFEKMRVFLERDGRADVGAVYGVFHLVCKGIALHKEQRQRELRSSFSKTACADCIHELKKHPGNLGPLQPVRDAIVEELGRYPDVDFEMLGKRIDAGFAAVKQA